MATVQSVKAKLQGLIDKSNQLTGKEDTTLTMAVDTLIDGFGVGDDLDEELDEQENLIEELKTKLEKQGSRSELNISFGYVEPEDKSKPWIKTGQPKKATISPEVSTETLPYILPIKMHSFGAATVGKKIYTFGGRVGSGSSDMLKTIHCFDTETGIITTCQATLLEVVEGCRCVTVGTKIYVIGGYTASNKGSTQKLCYDTELDTITSIGWGAVEGSTPIYPYGACIEAVGKTLYWFGGITSTGRYPTTATVRYCISKYDTETNSTTNIANKVPIYNFRPSVVYENKIYIFGANIAPNDVSGSEAAQIYCFDTETETFNILGSNLATTTFKTESGTVCHVIGDKIYLIDPVLNNSIGDTQCGRIYYYDPKTNYMTQLSYKIPFDGAWYVAYRTKAMVGNKLYLLGGYASVSGVTTYTDIIKTMSIMPNPTLEVDSVLITTDPYSNGITKLQSGVDLYCGVDRAYRINKDGNGEEVEICNWDGKEGIKRTKNYTQSVKEVESATALTSRIGCSVGDLVVAAIVTRDTLEISDGWTLISTSDINSNDTTGNGQRLSWAWKFAEYSMEQITVTQATTQRLYINMVALTGATGVTDNGYSYLNEAASEITVEKPIGNVLWGMTAPLWANSQPYGGWETSNDLAIIQSENTQQRLAIGLDQTKETSVKFTIPASSTMIIGSLTVEGLDEFYKDEPYQGIWKPVKIKRGDKDNVEYLE